MQCIVCEDGKTKYFQKIDDVDYFQCVSCQSIHADAAFIETVYSKKQHYDENYWGAECAAARERSFGSSLNRVAEVFLYARIPIVKFVDIGSGPGYLLDSLSIVMPEHSDMFYGVELYPPAHATQNSS